MRWRVAAGLIALAAGIAVLLLLARRSAPTDERPTDGVPAARVEPTGTSAAGTPRHANGKEADESPADSPSAVRVVRGTVVDGEKRPIADAEVLVLSADPSGREYDRHPVVDLAHPVSSHRTTADGTFEARVSGRAVTIVLARKDGFCPSSVTAPDEGAVELVLVAGAAESFRVIDERGHPIAGAEISSSGDASVVAATVTDAQGAARLVCNYHSMIRVRAAGFADEVFEPGEPGRRPNDRPIELVLREGRSVAGVVVDSEGRPLSGVRVSQHDPNGERDATRTGADGTFRFDGADARASFHGFVLDAEMEGRVAAEVEAVAGDMHIRIVMLHPASVSGVVVFADGTPVAGAKLNYNRVSGADGRFSITGLVPGRVEIWAQLRSPADPRMELAGVAVIDVPEGGEIKDARVVLGRPLDKSFLLVRLLDGERPQDVHIMAWIDGVEVGDSWLGGDDAKKDGARLVDIRRPPGAKVDVGAYIGPPTTSTHFAARSDKPVVTEAGPPFTPLDLHLGPPPTVRFKLVDPAGREVPFTAENVETKASQRDLAFEFPAVESFVAVIRVPGCAPRSVYLDPPHPATRELTLRLVPARRVVGRLLGDGDLPLFESADVWAGVLSDGEREEASTQPDGAGRFAFDALPPGRGELRVYLRDQWVHVAEFEVGADAETDLGQVRVGASAPFRALVLDEAGNGIGGARVEFLTADDRKFADALTTRPDGTFDAMLPASFAPRLLVQRTGFATRIVDAPKRTAEPVRVVLHPAGSVRVRVLHWIDAGYGHVEARLPGTNVSWSPHFGTGSLVTGDVYDDFPAGPIDVALVMRNGEIVKRVEVVAGQVVDVVFGE